MGRSARAVRVPVWWLLATGLACADRPNFSEAEIDAHQPGAGLPCDFWLGAGSAAHQVEGGNHNDWTDWEQGRYPDGGSHIKDGSQSGAAVGSWDHFGLDVDALQAIDANTYRLSIEWSRIEPQEGQFDQAALDHYRGMLLALQAARIRPVVTLMHFTLPQWFAQRGGWEWAGALDSFQRYVTFVAQQLGDLVDDWVTLNEPTVYALFAYVSGQWPPGVTDMRRGSAVLRTLLAAHARAARALRANDLLDADGDGRATFIGLSHHLVLFQPATSSALDTTVAALSDDWANEAVPRAIATGRVQLTVPGQVAIDEVIEGLAASADFYGLNFYYRLYLRADLTQASLAQLYVPYDHPRSDVGGELYPEGLYRALKRAAVWGLPVVVTENGIADGADQQRPEFLRAAFYALARARADGVDVRGYLYWSLTDNFEWSEGFSARFGLFAVDPADPELRRVARPTSTALFRDAADWQCDEKH